MTSGDEDMPLDTAKDTSRKLGMLDLRRGYRMFGTAYFCFSYFFFFFFFALAFFFVPAVTLSIVICNKPRHVFIASEDCTLFRCFVSMPSA